jgi:hypothetical protein
MMFFIRTFVAVAEVEVLMMTLQDIGMNSYLVFCKVINLKKYVYW